eukprot:Phypoly_transcript_26433.p1 GENE.Phypoly_transcript_26433~~Phypoly_transcript_26433.p1  ORF type:complete len:119 (+),score=25.88 Phypoly_transcript_26433:113-469(+)
MSGKGKGKAKGKDSGGGDEGGKVKAANHVKVRHILCEKQGRIQEAHKKITEDGESFDKVAREYSEDKARSGGSLGWMARGSMVEPFQTKAFTQPIGVVSEPFKTVHGFHILLVEERKA